MRSWNRSPRLTRRALREGGGLDLDVLHCRGPTTSWCARVRHQPYKTSRDQLRMPLALFYAKHYAAALLRKSWQTYFDGSLVHWLDKRLEFFQEVFCTLHWLTSCVIIVPTLWQSGGRDGAQAGKFLRTYQRSSRSPFNFPTVTKEMVLAIFMALGL